MLNDARVKAMLLMAPTIRFKETFTRTLHGKYAGEKFFEEINKINSIKESQIKAVKCPIMIVHGSKDDEVNPNQSRELFEMANKPKEFLLLKNGKHVLTRYQETRKKIVQLSLDWFNKYLK